MRYRTEMLLVAVCFPSTAVCMRHAAFVGFWKRMTVFISAGVSEKHKPCHSEALHYS